jgi:hypothetical protein
VPEAQGQYLSSYITPDSSANVSSSTILRGEKLNLKKDSFTRNLCSIQGPARNESETSQYFINIPTPASRQWKGKIEKIKFVRSNNKTVNLACDLKKVMLFL